MRRLIDEPGDNNDARRRSRSRSRSPRGGGPEGFVYTRQGVSISYARAEEMLHRLNARNPETLPGLSECLIVGPPPALLVPLPLEARWQAALEGVEDNHESPPFETDVSEQDEQD